ncbi:hypothetical protein KQI36_15820 [Clostridium senegalense]|uniref:hypothetical protein n=1 Tax=Clostridium senegalense TaxID=1465809 RepID=UPI001C117A02|nr:hypothetical protein [Clostridium senegalense]MBU5228100.1 hypothetical protein [Clostridium senegalense]
MKIEELLKLLTTEEGRKKYDEIIAVESEKELKRTKELIEKERERKNDECKK